jgi:hypothetical protein
MAGNAWKDLGFLLLNIGRGLVSDCKQGATISSLSYVVMRNGCMGFVSYSKVTKDWFCQAENTCIYNEVNGWPQSWLATWPLASQRLSATALVSG